MAQRKMSYASGMAVAGASNYQSPKIAHAILPRRAAHALIACSNVANVDGLRRKIEMGIIIAKILSIIFLLGLGYGALLWGGQGDGYHASPRDAQETGGCIAVVFAFIALMIAVSLIVPLFE